MPKRQPTLFCRICRVQRPRELFSGRIVAGGYWHPWSECDECRAKRPPCPVPPDLPGEQWLPVHGHEATYEISNYTRVRRITATRVSRAGALISPVLANGYLRVSLSNGDGGRCYFVHRLYLETFVGPIPAGLVVNHIDGDKTNNHLSNLEVVTRAENNAHARRTGLCDTRGERHWAAKLTEGQVRAIRSSREKLTELATRYGVSFQLVSQIRLGKAWRHVTQA